MAGLAPRGLRNSQALTALWVRLSFISSVQHPYWRAESILPKGAFLRSWVFIEETELLVYNIGGNRYCHHIGREHKSNHTMMVADISRGVCYQRCHDPDCKAARDFNAPKILLPAVTIYPELARDLQDLSIPVIRSLAT